MSAHPSSIQPDEWSAFFEQLSQEHRGRIVSIEANDPDSDGRLYLQDVPLEGMSLVLQGNEEVISIVVREHARVHTVYTVKNPLRVTYENPGGVAKSLQIESEEGATTIVRFRSASIPEAIQAQTIPEPGH
jgi:hypothetical protein